MEHGLKLPWWEFRPTDLALPGSVAPPDTHAEEGLVARFLHAAARAETADYFISANSLNVAGVLDVLSREELVMPAPPAWASKRQGHHEPQIGCRSRLFGMPLADRHAALTVACSLRHKLPRRALVNFVCRLVLGKGVEHLPSPQADDEYGYPRMDEVPRRPGGGQGLCACGKKSVSVRGAATRPRGHASSGEAAASGTSTACRACLARRGWLDSVSARLLVVACRKLLWDKALPEDEARAVDRCLSALSDTLGEASETQGKSSRDLEASPRDGASLPAGAVEAQRVGVSAVRAGVRRRRSQAAGAGGNFAADYDQNQVAGNGAGGGDGGGAIAVDSETQFTGGAEGDGGLLRTTPPRPKKKAARGASSARGEPDCRSNPSRLEGGASISAGAIGGGLGQASGTEQPKTTTATTAASAGAAVGVEEAQAPSSLTEGGEGEAKDPDCLPPAIRQTVSSVAEKVAAAGARGATSADVQSAAAATISLLQEAMKLPSNHASSATNTHPAGAVSKRPSVQQQQQQPPLEAVCVRLGLNVSRGKGAGAAAAVAATATAGCGDDLVMAVCDGFVTPALSLRNCLAFVRVVLVPRARALTTPASRLLVTAVSGIGKARPGVVIDGLVLPLLCQGDPSAVGSAQCELCTRLIKQVLPKHTLEALLVGLCGGVVHDDNAQATDGWDEGPHGGGGGSGNDRKPGQQQEATSRCVWTELTMPVMTAALNLKPALSDQAIAALVRAVESAAEQPKLQKSLKFTTLIHSLVTRYGPQLKPHVPMLRAAVGRCSTFMVKAVLAALQRLEK